jgi:hypothetical protein
MADTGARTSCMNCGETIPITTDMGGVYLCPKCKPKEAHSWQDIADLLVEVERLERALAPFAMCNPHRPPNWVDPIQWAINVERAYGLLVRREGANGTRKVGVEEECDETTAR